MIRHHAWLWLAVASLAGCPPSVDHVDDDTTADDDADDDDTGDDDASDDDAGDDDSGDDDSGDDDAGHMGFDIDLSFEASGGLAGGPATTTMVHKVVDGSCDELCRIEIEFQGEYTHGTDQGVDFWPSQDEIVTWTSGQEVYNDCPPQWQPYKGDPADWFRWYLHPIAVVGCEQIAADPKLAATFVGDDPSQLGDGTLGEYCSLTGPGVQAQLGSGPVEGIWFAPGVSGSLDGLGDYAYFAPADTTHVEVWMLMGLLLAADSSDEPTPGLDGSYELHWFWHWMFGNYC